MNEKTADGNRTAYSPTFPVWKIKKKNCLNTNPLPIYERNYVTILNN